MLALFSLAVTLFFLYQTYQQARRRGDWSWRQFFLLIGLIAVFAFGFVLPVINSKTLEARPEFFFPVFLGGIAVFIAVLILLFRKRPVSSGDAGASPGESSGKQ